MPTHHPTRLRTERVTTYVVVWCVCVCISVVSGSKVYNMDSPEGSQLQVDKAVHYIPTSYMLCMHVQYALYDICPEHSFSSSHPLMYTACFMHCAYVRPLTVTSCHLWRVQLVTSCHCHTMHCTYVIPPTVTSFHVWCVQLVTSCHCHTTCIQTLKLTFTCVLSHAL